ncbi:3-isopropylmalate dehydratase large subunit [Jannaschia sp. LMIT008]|uniref:3-isopropylmalate dehydratase large subunit n=1 Tax=Jannaschia maritima TaxID=3032585 RepID=UPI00281219ED|nr:3-isopropylmalate dehydratase large subunit [Jannaschia sp. LMIT008]
MTSLRTAFDKMLDAHTVRRFDDGTALVHVDRIMLHERTGSVALTSLIEDGRAIDGPDRVFATVDHIVSTLPGQRHRARSPGGEVFIDAMRDACDRLGLRLWDGDDPRQGIVHVIAPEQGVALPGITMVCPDSHTCTLGGLGALAWGIGSTDAEHALATRCLRIGVPGTMRVWIEGERPAWMGAKDIALHLIATHGAAGGRGFAVEYDGPAVRALAVEARLTLCNLSVEFAAFTGFVTADDATIDYVRGRPFAPGPDHWDAAVAGWQALATDAGAAFDREIRLDLADVSPAVSWGTSPEHMVPLAEPIPEPLDDTRRAALDYMGLTPGRPLAGEPLDGAFIGSCTNARLSDLERAAAILRGRRVADGVRAVVVPGSTAVKREAEARGLDTTFRDAGFEWQESGCALCFHAGGEGFPPGARVISSTNRNFEGRQGPRVRTHIASPETVAWSALQGRISDVREVPG